MAQPRAGEFAVSVVLQNALDCGVVGFRRRGAESERNRTQIKFEEPVAAPRLRVIVALGSRPRDNLDLPIIQTEMPISRGDLRFKGTLIGQEHACRTALDNRRRDSARLNICERLRGKDHRGVLLPECLEPLADLRSERVVIERKPAFIDNQKRGTTGKASFDSVKEIGKNGRCAAATDQTFGFECLDIGTTKMLLFGIKQSAPGAAYTVWLQSLFEPLRLQEHCKAGEGSLLKWSGRKRIEGRPDMILYTWDDGDILACEKRRNPFGRPGCLPNREEDKLKVCCAASLPSWICGTWSGGM